jgi:hypothetical protein
MVTMSQVHPTSPSADVASARVEASPTRIDRTVSARTIDLPADTARAAQQPSRTESASGVSAGIQTLGRQSRRNHGQPHATQRISMRPGNVLLSADLGVSGSAGWARGPFKWLAEGRTASSSVVAGGRRGGVAGSGPGGPVLARGRFYWASLRVARWVANRCVRGFVVRCSALLSVGVFAGHVAFVLVSGSACPSWHARGQRFEPA